MKKTAILLSGFYREVNNIDNIIKNIITPNNDYEFDIIFCVWVLICNMNKERQLNIENQSILNLENLLITYKPICFSTIDFFNFQKYLVDNKKIENIIENNNYGQFQKFY